MGMHAHLKALLICLPALLALFLLWYSTRNGIHASLCHNIHTALCRISHLHITHACRWLILVTLATDEFSHCLKRISKLDMLVL